MKLLLLDKDGTLIYPKSGAKFVGDTWDHSSATLGIKRRFPVLLLVF